MTAGACRWWTSASRRAGTSPPFWSHLDRGMPAEPAPRTRRAAAGSAPVGRRRGQGSACPLHLHHRIRARAPCGDRRRHSGGTGKANCRRADRGQSALFLDNLNNTAFKSDLLASAITERPARVRVLGKSQMVPLNAIRVCDLDRQRAERLGGPCPPLHRRELRPAHRGSGGAAVHHRHPRGGDGAAH